ncbi:hypothetical protein QE152_g10410 [Popillia japonica]|uniref:Uncharacterized protein n=1 Tax=Popillia japonica TaxID=7064 RepID=A0AAW1LTS3_POPJA
MGKMEKKYGVSLGMLEELKNCQIRNSTQTLKMQNSVDVSLTDDTRTRDIQNCILKFENNVINIKNSVGTRIIDIHYTEIVLRKISPLKISLQMKPDSLFELITIKFNSEQDKNIIAEMLPPPAGSLSFHGDTDSSSSSEWYDSGRGETGGRTSS